MKNKRFITKRFIKLLTNMIWTTSKDHYSFVIKADIVILQKNNRGSSYRSKQFKGNILNKKLLVFQLLIKKTSFFENKAIIAQHFLTMDILYFPPPASIRNKEKKYISYKRHPLINTMVLYQKNKENTKEALN